MEQNKVENLIIEEKIQKNNGEIHIRKYKKGRLLGKGGFAKCFEFTNIETQQVMASKIIPKSTLSKNRARQKLISEIKIHKSLKNINVVQFEHVFEDSENVYILLELCTNQTLNELLKRRKRLSELEVQCYLVQLIQSIKYLHANKVIHRDLKLGNLFLNHRMEIKLGDFGLAAKLEFNGERRRTVCGTPNYIAPEILENKNGHSYEVDVWSIGVIIYILLVGKPPFESPDQKTTYKKIKMNSYSYPDHISVSDNARDLITKILNLDPSQRPKLDEISSHDFLNKSIIPKFLPQSTLSCPPSAAYLKQFLVSTNYKSPFQSTKMSDGGLSNENFNQTDTNKLLSDKGLSQSNFNHRPQTDSKNPQNQKLLSQKNLRRASLASVLQNQSKNSENWVKSWVDYSSKYGLGYLLGNGSTGVFFNDQTKMILDQSHTYFEYLEKKPQDRQDVVAQYAMNDYPKELSKKVTLMNHFKSYLDHGPKDKNIEEVNKNLPLIYVKKWMKTRHAIMFRLSNKIVQVNFTDKTEILLQSEDKQVSFTNKKGEKISIPLSTALESNNQEMQKRLKYTKEILTHMLSQNNRQDEQENQ